jgi:predicted kinase
MLQKVILMRGLPGSGKSTWAKKLVSENPNAYKRINRDDLRLMFDNGYTDKDTERFIRQVRDLLIEQALQAGKSVIVDDTNLSDTNLQRITQIVNIFNKANNQKVTIEIKEIDTPLEECIARDAARAKPVGEKVIRQMHQQFFAPSRVLEYAEQSEDLPKAIICDLDGTLAFLGNRNPYDAAKAESDTLNKPIADMLKTYHDLGYRILLVSGRSETHREPTVRWLEKHQIAYEVLLMRAAKDSRKDSIVKREIYDQHIALHYNIAFILDDRNQVVDMWRKDLKLPCLQVNYGDF